MKSTTLLFALPFALLLTACGAEEKPAETETEAPQETVAPAQPTEDNSTSVKVGPDGVEVKSGNTNVSVRQDSGSVEIKKP